MYAIKVDPGQQLLWQQSDLPRVEPGQVLIKVAAAGVNRADVLQAAGHYPPPPGVTTTLGLEVSGTIAKLGSGVSGWSLGQPVCALLAGGGYAEYVAVPLEQLLPIPVGISLVDAAGLPEVAATVWSNLIQVGDLSAEQLVLIHGGAGGVGAHAIQVAHCYGARVVATAGSAQKLDFCRSLGADITINYHTEDFVDIVRQLGGADIILDIMGASYLDRNINAIAPDGKIIIIGLQGGIKSSINLNKILNKRIHIIGTALRSRPISGPGGKAEIIKALQQDIWPMIEDGRIISTIGAYLPIDQAEYAHHLLMSGQVSGKIILTVE